MQDIQFKTRLPVGVWHLGENVDLSNTQNETWQSDSEWHFIIIGYMDILNERGYKHRIPHSTKSNNWERMHKMHL